MSGAVGNVSDEVHILAFLATEETVNGIDENLDDVKVFPLVEAANVVSISDFAIVENNVDCPCVILYIEPVSNIFALAIHRQRTAMAYVVDKQWNQLLWELIRTIIVATISYDGRQSVSVVERPHKMVARRLGSRIWRMRLILQIFREKLFAVSQMVLAARRLCGERRLDSFGVGHLQRAINLVSGNVVEPLALKLLRQRLPVQFCSLQERQSAHHVGLCKRERILDGAVNVALCGEVDDAVDLLVLHQLIERIKVADVHPDKLVVGLVLNVFEVGEIARVGKFVKVNYLIIKVFINKKAYNMTPDKTCAARDNDVFHIINFRDCQYIFELTVQHETFTPNVCLILVLQPHILYIFLIIYKYLNIQK